MLIYWLSECRKVFTAFHSTDFHDSLYPHFTRLNNGTINDRTRPVSQNINLPISLQHFCRKTQISKTSVSQMAYQNNTADSA